MRFFCALSKADENDDGTVTVSGIASSEATDSAGEVVKASAIKAALPDFFAHGSGNLREMHQLSAAGTVDTAEVDETTKQTTISATVVDPVAILKIRSGTYKGFSVGGKVLERDPANRKIITKIRLNEISLVDRPSCPEAVFDVWKADGAEEDTMTEATAAQASAAEAAPAEEPKAVEPTVTVGAPEGATMVEPAPEAEPAPEPVAEVDSAEASAAAESTPEAEPVAKADAGVAGSADALPADPLARAAAALSALEASVAKASETGDLAKGMYTVQRFADVISSIASIVSSCTCEADYEGDNSPVPAKLRAWLVSGAALFKEMAAEEIEELVAEVTAQKAAASAALAKAADAADLATVSAERDDLLAKAAERDAAATALADRVETLAKALEGQTARLARVEAEPVPAKTAGTFAKAAEATPVSKEQDAAGAQAAPAAPTTLTEDDVRKALDAMPDEERFLLLTKAAHARPIMISQI